MLRFNAIYQGEGKYNKIDEKSTPVYETEIVLSKEFALHKVKLNLIVDIRFADSASCNYKGVMYKEDGNYGIFQLFNEKGNPESWYAVEK